MAGETTSVSPKPSRVTPLNNSVAYYNDGKMGNPTNRQPEHAVDARERDWTNMTRTIAHYERIEQIGEGTYGQVYRARCKDTNQIVALKKIRVHHGGYWGMPPTVIREIKILKRLRHPNLVQMVEVVSSKGVEHLDEEDEVSEKHKNSKKDRIVDAREGYKGNLFLVLEYVSHDLTGLMDVAYRFSEVQVKCIFRQLLEALQYMHENKYVHRDIKSSNILIDHNFRVKLADFGLARCLEPAILDKIHDRGNSQEFTNKVITLWYRPPELLLGATKYGTSVDIWSAGCILVELILGKPLFTGKTEMDQLKLIFEMLGTPTAETWEGFHDLKLLRTGEVTIETTNKAKLREKYRSKMSGQALNLVEKLLELDPQKRYTASTALDNRYFKAEPVAPERPEELGALEGHFHERQTKRMRKEAKVLAEKARQTALEGGCSEKEAQEQYDTTYRGIVAKVAKEGLKAVEPEEKTEPISKESPDTEERSRREKMERKRGSRDKDREPRKEKRSSREEHRDERKRESRDKEKKKRRRDEGRSKRKMEEGSDYITPETKGEERVKDASEAVDKSWNMGDRNGGSGSDQFNREGRSDERSLEEVKSRSSRKGRDGSRSREHSRDHRVSRDEDRRLSRDGKSRSSRRRRDRSRSRDRSRERGRGRNFGARDMNESGEGQRGGRGLPPHNYEIYGRASGDSHRPLPGESRPSSEFFPDQRRRESERSVRQRGNERY